MQLLQYEFMSTGDRYRILTDSSLFICFPNRLNVYLREFPPLRLEMELCMHGCGMTTGISHTRPWLFYIEDDIVTVEISSMVLFSCVLVFCSRMYFQIHCVARSARNHISRP